MGEDYQNLMVTGEFVASIQSLDPPATPEDLAGILQALDDLDAEPGNTRNRLHILDRELADWWSLTPPPPASQALRILVAPQRDRRGGFWRVGPATWHYWR